MSKDPRQRHRHFPFRLWMIVFKAIIAIGQVATLVSKLLSMRE